MKRRKLITWGQLEKSLGIKKIADIGYYKMKADYLKNQNKKLSRQIRILKKNQTPSKLPDVINLDYNKLNLANKVKFWEERIPHLRWENERLFEDIDNYKRCCERIREVCATESKQEISLEEALVLSYVEADIENIEHYLIYKQFMMKP